MRALALGSWVCFVAACGGGSDGGSDAGGGRIAGQVVVSGPLAGAAISVDQLRLDGEPGSVRAHVGDTTTDADGRFALDVGAYNGVLRVTARGGAYVDLATSATIALDRASGLSSLAVVGVLEQRDDVLVSPVGHLIDARTMAGAAAGADLFAAEKEAALHLNKHFGDVDWTRLKLPTLAAAATSPTEGVRAALVQAALSLLAQDVAQAAGTSAQDVTVLTLATRWATDLATGVFDGDDGNDRGFGTGLQLGACPPVPAPCTVPTSGCQLGACRTLCDAYAGTPRALLAAAMAKAIRAPLNQTGLAFADLVPVALAVAGNTDEALFGPACVESLDRLAPSLLWSPATPADGAYVRGALRAQVTAVDDVDPTPVAAIDGFADADGDRTNAVAQVDVDTTTRADGALALVATAVDLSGNRATATRALIVDNTAPALALDPAGFFVDGAAWWTAADGPTLRGTITDAAPTTVALAIGGATVATSGPVTGAFAVALPPGMLGLAGADVTVTATDAAGNATSVVQKLRYDAAPPALQVGPSAVRDEANEAPAFVTLGTGPLAIVEVASHDHTAGAEVRLDTAGSCPTLTKFADLLDEAPAFVKESAPNPVRYLLTASDDGVGLDPATAQVRIGRRDAAGVPAWVVDWSSLGGGTAVGTAVQYGVGLYRRATGALVAVPGLGAADGVYDVQVRVADRLGRVTEVARCVDLRVLPPWLHWGAPGRATGHAYALASLAFGGAVATRLLNTGGTGASILDAPVVNGTDEPVHVSVRTPATQAFTVSRTFVTSNAMTNRVATTSSSCDVIPAPAACFGPPLGPEYGPATITRAEVDVMTVRVFETSAAGAPVTEVPCTSCAGSPPQPAAGHDFEFTLPGRSATMPNPPPRTYLVMTMLARSPALVPSDASSVALEPFADFALGGVGMTGKLGTGATGCVATGTAGPVASPYTVCTAQGKVTPYRTLTAATISNVAAIIATFGAALTPGGAYVTVGPSASTLPLALLSIPAISLPPKPGAAPL